MTLGDEARALAEAYLVPFGVHLLVALLVFVLGRMLARLVVRILGRLLDRSKVDASLRHFLCDVAYAVLLVIVVIAALDQLGVETTAAIAVLGAMGLAIGLALQGSLGNFAAGVMIIVFKPYRVGDVVNLAGHIGKVEAIKVFQTVIITGDNRQVTLPNGTVQSGVIENITARPTRRVDLVFGIGYDDDLARAKEILHELVAADERILQDPEPFIAVTDLAESSVNLACRPWTKTSDWWAVRCDLTERAKLAFDAAGISIPFPQRDVHVHEAKQGSA